MTAANAGARASGAAVALEAADTAGPSPFDTGWVVIALDGEAEIDRLVMAAVAPTGSEPRRFAGRIRRFAAEARCRRRPGPGERWDVELEVSFEAPLGEAGGDASGEDAGEAAVDAGIEVRLRLGPTDDPRWLIPGLFYGENRPAASRARYPRFGAAGEDPCTAPAWGFRVDRAAIPVVWARDARHGVALATREQGPLGLNGLGFALAGGHPELRLAFPYREEPVSYDGSPEPGPPDRPTHRWRPGEAISLAFSVYRTPSTPYAWAPVLEDLRDELAGDSSLRPWLAPDPAAALAAEGLLRWHARSSPPVLIETAAFDRRGDGRRPEPGDREAMHVGWLSGAPAAAALLAHGRRTGNPEARAAGVAVLDHLTANLAPCGTFWGQWTADRGWTKGWTPGDERLHARTLGEATLFVARAATVSGDDVARWRAAVASNLEFVVAHQREDGAIPAAWHARTGAPTLWDGCAGLAWVPALVEGAALLGRAELLLPAARAGRYYATFVDSELLFGAPEDVDLGPTSEDGYVAVMAYVALAESTPPGPERDRWLELARRAADWMLTFRYAWNVAFDPSTTLGRLDYRTRGMDQASPANQHLHTYGLVALAETIRLGRLTGDRRLATRSREHFAAARQLVARFDGDFGARRGMVPERAYQTACFGPKGEIGRLSHAWCLGLLLWACESAAELPELDTGVDGAELEVAT